MFNRHSGWLLLALAIVLAAGAAFAVKVHPKTALAAQPAAPSTTQATTPATTPAAAQPALEVYLFKNPKPAPSLQVTTLDGRHLSLASLRGKVVLLNFWATWCGPCREEIPEFERLQKQYAGQLQVVGMSVDELPPAAVQKVAAQMGINYPVAMAPSAVQARFGGSPVFPSIPVTMVIDRQGNIQQKNHGANSYEVFNAEIRALLELPMNGVHVARIDQLSPDGKVGTIDIPGIAAALKKLTPAQRQQALAALNQQACSCGCEWSLATCRVKDPSCGFSLPEAKQLIASLASGDASGRPSAAKMAP
ncbi:MAG TPA: TlpA disulfide reductase family protein [Terriglobales bacterium]|jgi:thiol-disulfide isomerase/thioredoxin